MNDFRKPLRRASFTMPGLALIANYGLATNGMRFHSSAASATVDVDPARIEAAITPQTMAIMPVHCNGQPFDFEAIQKIDENYNLKVIYNAARAFRVDDNAGRILRHSDLSVLSFHATNVFNSFEGGAIVCTDARTKQRIDRLKNFGIVGEVTVVASGINGKMSEINAAFGILQRKYFDHAPDCRRDTGARYRHLLKDMDGIRCVKSGHETTANYSYFPILLEPGYPMSRNALYEELKRYNINSCCYFFPLISDFPMCRGCSSEARTNLPEAAAIANKSLCLPIYPDLAHATINAIIDIIATAARSRNVGMSSLKTWRLAAKPAND